MTALLDEFDAPKSANLLTSFGQHLTSLVTETTETERQPELVISH